MLTNMDPPSSSHTFITETGMPTQKRRKARLACNSCRARKTGCDGRKPVCSACSLRGWAERCSWQDSVMNNSSALSLVDLDRRLQRLESEARVESEAPRTADQDPLSPVTNSDSAKSSLDRDGSSFDGVYYGTLASGDTTVFSMTSNSTYLQQAVDAASPDAVADPGFDHMVPNLVGFSLDTIFESFGDFDRLAIVLPPHSFANALLDWFWKYVHSLYPILHKPTFMSLYNRLWVEPTVLPQYGGHGFDELMFHATLNIVLALGCQRNESISVSQREYQAEEFYKRSQRLISIEALDTSSVAVVQLLLLRTFYLFFAVRADRCWLTSGAAIRMALGMGLNAAVYTGVTTQLEREIRRRVWHAGCVAWDTILSSTFGRPTLISKQMNLAPLPLAIDDEYLSTTGEATQPKGIPSRITLCIYTQHGIEIMDDMRSVVFSSRPKPGRVPGNESPGPDPSLVLRINSKIDDFFNEAPAHLRSDADYDSLGLEEEDIEFFRIQAAVVKARGLFARLLLLRPSVLAEVHRWARSRPTNNNVVNSSARLQERFHEEICSLCLSTVHTVLQDIHENLNTNKRYPPWYALQVTFSAATVLIVAALAPNLGVVLDLEPARSSWERVLHIFDSYKESIPSATTGVEVLRHLRMRIASGVAVGQGTPVSMPRGVSVQPVYTHDHERALHGPAIDGGNIVYGYNSSSGAPTTMSGVAEAPMPEISMGGLDEILTSNSLDQAWLSMQDFGHDNWILNYTGAGSGGHPQHQQ